MTRADVLASPSPEMPGFVVGNGQKAPEQAASAEPLHNLVTDAFNKWPLAQEATYAHQTTESTLRLRMPHAEPGVHWEVGLHQLSEPSLADIPTIFVDLTLIDAAGERQSDLYYVANGAVYKKSLPSDPYGASSSRPVQGILQYRRRQERVHQALLHDDDNPPEQVSMSQLEQLITTIGGEDVAVIPPSEASRSLLRGLLRSISPDTESKDLPRAVIARTPPNLLSRALAEALQTPEITTGRRTISDWARAIQAEKAQFSQPGKSRRLRMLVQGTLAAGGVVAAPADAARGLEANREAAGEAAGRTIQRRAQKWLDRAAK